MTERQTETDRKSPADRAERIERATALAGRRRALEAAQPGMRARDLAAALGASEAELVAARVGAEPDAASGAAIRLAGDLRRLVERLPSLGRVMVLTRNDTAVHERKGVFGNISTSGHVGLVLNEAIDLRLFFAHWRCAFAVEEEVRSGRRRSLQIFDAAGEAVHKIYLLEGESDGAAFDVLVNAFRAEDQAPGLSLRPPRADRKSAADADAVDRQAFLSEWRALQDTHDFHGMLRRHKVGRLDAMRLGAPEFVTPAPADALAGALDLAARRETPIMVFVGNRGCIQIHSGPIKAVRPVGDWDNVLDPDFNLHVRRDRVAEAFVVRKPTVDGDVTALELFDADGGHVLQMFGVRKPGVPEAPAWRRLTEDLLAGGAPSLRAEVPA